LLIPKVSTELFKKLFEFENFRKEKSLWDDGYETKLSVVVVCLG